MVKPSSVPVTHLSGSPQILSEFAAEADLAGPLSGVRSRRLAVALLILALLAAGGAIAWFVSVETRAIDVDTSALPARPTWTAAAQTALPPVRTIAGEVGASTSPPAAVQAIDGSYAIQVASFSSRSRADRLVTELAQAGFRARTVEFNLESPTASSCRSAWTVTRVRRRCGARSHAHTRTSRLRRRAPAGKLTDSCVTNLAPTSISTRTDEHRGRTDKHQQSHRQASTTYTDVFPLGRRHADRDDRARPNGIEHGPAADARRPFADRLRPFLDRSQRARVRRRRRRNLIDRSGRTPPGAARPVRDGSRWCRRCAARTSSSPCSTGRTRDRRRQFALSGRHRTTRSPCSRGVRYVDMGTSGGVWGLERGFCLMIGGDADVVQRLDPMFAALSPGRISAGRAPADTASRGYLYCGPRARVTS